MAPPAIMLVPVFRRPGVRARREKEPVVQARSRCGYALCASKCYGQSSMVQVRGM